MRFLCSLPRVCRFWPCVPTPSTSLPMPLLPPPHCFCFSNFSHHRYISQGPESRRLYFEDGVAVQRKKGHRARHVRGEWRGGGPSTLPKCWQSLRPWQSQCMLCAVATATVLVAPVLAAPCALCPLCWLLLCWLPVVLVAPCAGCSCASWLSCCSSHSAPSHPPCIRFCSRAPSPLPLSVEGVRQPL